MTTVRITGMLEGEFYGSPPSDTVYEVSSEIAKAALAVIEGHSIDAKPISLTERTSKGNYHFNNPVKNAPANDIPHHTSEGDEIEILDNSTKESFKVKLTKDFYTICYFNRPGSFRADAKNVEIIKNALKLAK